MIDIALPADLARVRERDMRECIDVLRAAAGARDGQSLIDAIDELNAELNNTRNCLEQSEHLRREALANRDALAAEVVRLGKLVRDLCWGCPRRLEVTP